MAGLTSRQRAHLRALAHDLAPVVTVGKAGPTDAVHREVDDALAARELIKVKLPGDREERAALADEIERAGRAEIVGAIGRVAILWRRQRDPARRRVALPDGCGASRRSPSSSPPAAAAIPTRRGTRGTRATGRRRRGTSRGGRRSSRTCATKTARSRTRG